MFEFFKKKAPSIDEAAFAQMRHGMNGAGFVVAQIALELSKGGRFDVVIGEMFADDNFMMNKVDGFEWLSQSIEKGREMIAGGNPSSYKAMVYDTHIKSPDTNVITQVIAVELGKPLNGLYLAIPYTPQNSNSGFSLSKLKVISCPPHLSEIEHALVNWFFDGIEAHENGAQVWQKYYYEQFM